MNEIKQKILTVMAVVFEMDVADIPEDAAPGVIEKWDSLKHLSLILALEEEFNARFTDEEMMDILNLNLIHEIISAKLGSES